MDYEIIRKYIKELNNPKIYIGCDSEAFKRNGKKYANYYRVIVVHEPNRRDTLKIFRNKITEIDYSSDKRKPLFRLMQEVYKTSEMYLELADILQDLDVEVHLDLNPSEKHVSNQVVDQAIGYIRGTCNVHPKIKPDAWVSTHVADRFLRT